MSVRPESSNTGHVSKHMLKVIMKLGKETKTKVEKKAKLSVFKIKKGTQL